MSMYLASLSLLATSASPPVDTVRQSLIAASDRWFHWLVVSSIVVGVGVCLEAPEGTITLKRWFRHWKNEESIPPENERSLVIPASYLGLLLVILGVIGEGAFEGLSSNAETALRAHDEQVLASTITQAGDAAGSAERANTAAGEAKTKSDGAKTVADQASEFANGARKVADSFEKKIDDANMASADSAKAATDAVSRLTNAERQLTDATQKELVAEEALRNLKMLRSLIHTKELTTALKPYKGTEYVLNTFQDDESIQFTRAIGNELEAAGWVRKQPAGPNLGIPAMNVFFHDGSTKEIVPSCLENGISVHAYTKLPLAALQAMPFSALPQSIRAALAFIKSAAPSISPPDPGNVHAGAVDPKPEEETVPMTICVGKKP